MGIHFKPSVDPGQAIDPNITYINFSTFPVSSETLKKPIEGLYNLQEGCSFPIPTNFKMVTEALIAADLKNISVLAGIDQNANAGVPTRSGYDVEGEKIGELGEIGELEPPGNGIDFAGGIQNRYRRLDVSDALFENMSKRIFNISPVLVCQTSEQCQVAYDIIHYFHFHANPSLIEMSGDSPILKIAPPLGFAVWASEFWPSPLFTDNYFPVVNHSFLSRVILTSADSGQSLTPYSILNSETNEQHPLRIQLDLTFIEIQPAYKSTNNIIRNRSVAPVFKGNTTTKTIP